MIEVWKDIKDYEGLYQVSNTGKVRKLRFINNIVNKEKIFELSKKHNNHNYCIVVLYKNGKNKTRLLHRIVAETFIENPNNYREVNHKDGNKDNNFIDNLEWCTSSQNKIHAYKMGLKKPSSLGLFGGNNPKAKSVNMIDKETNKIIKRFNSLIEARDFINVSSSGGIVNCCKGKLKTYKGYKWEYANGR